MTDGSDREASSIAWAILKQVERIGEYKHNMFLNSDNVPKGLFSQQVAGYAMMINELENLMWPILEGDTDYSYELGQKKINELTYPPSSDPKVCYEYLQEYDKKYKIIAKRFWRFGLMPIVATTLNMITRTQKYEKFKKRIKAQAIKYIDLYGEELVEYVRKKRESKNVSEPREYSEAKYSETYKDFLKEKKIDYDGAEEDAIAYVEEN